MPATIQNSRKLADYLLSLDIYSSVNSNISFEPVYNHLGALLTDIVLQSGLNYNTVVRPRVSRVLEEFYYATTTQLIHSAINVYGVSFFLSWQNSIKNKRFIDVLQFCQDNHIDEEKDFCYFLNKKENREKFLSIKGVGHKTIDYAKKLMGNDCVAVDRHIINFVHRAGIKANDYDSIKLTVEYAADFLNLPRKGVDSFIWMKMNKSSQNAQISLPL